MSFYCQHLCGEEDFSIDEWNATAKALELTNLSKKEKQAILLPDGCITQCERCVEIVGEARIKTKKLLNK